MAKAGGHLFIINGDVQKLACDAWLLPTDEHLTVTASFAAAIEDRVTPYGDGDFKVENFTWNGSAVGICKEAVDGEPAIWLADVGVAPFDAKSTESVVKKEVSEWFGRRAGEFVRLAAAEATTRGVIRPIVALPIIGSGDGGLSEHRGKLLKGLLSAIYEALETTDCDVVLVAWGRVAYAAAQQARRNLVESAQPEALFALEEHHLSEAERLASEAKNGNLVVFIGAGVSAQAGLPNWQLLLDGVAKNLEWSGNIEELHQLDERDQATVLAKFASSPEKFDQAVAKALEGNSYALLHGLISSLPVDEFVTTNFDTLFEQSAETGGRTLRVLPRDSVEAGRRWLVKIHGDLGSDVVLTRSQYIGAGFEKGALLGLVQALLLTRHMLFVGYGLRDDDFHALMHEVRSAFDSAKKPAKLGTVLNLFENEAFTSLWNDLYVGSFGDYGDEVEAVRDASRKLSIFLDYVGFLSASKISFLLEKTYDGLGSGEMEELVSAIRALKRVKENNDLDEGLRAELSVFLARFEDVV